MDLNQLVELFITSSEKFGTFYTLLGFALLGLIAYLMKNKSKSEKLLSQTMEQINKANSESVKVTADNIVEIKNMVLDVLETMNQLNGEMKGVVDIIKFLTLEQQKNSRYNSKEGGEQ